MSSPRPSVKVTYKSRTSKKKASAEDGVSESSSEEEADTQKTEDPAPKSKPKRKGPGGGGSVKIKGPGQKVSTPAPKEKAKDTPVKRIDFNDFKKPADPVKSKRTNGLTPAGSQDSTIARPSSSIGPGTELRRPPSSSPSSSAKKPASVRSMKSTSKRPSAPTAPSESEHDDTHSVADSFLSASRSVRRTEPERIEYFRNQPECDKNCIEPHSVLCLRCGNTVNLGKRSTYTVKPWEAHRLKCDAKVPASVAPSDDGTVNANAKQSKATRKPRLSEDSRKASLAADTRAAQIKPDEVLCARCNKWIKLSTKQTYALSNWEKHQQTCSESVPSDRVATAERKMKLVNDPQQKDFGTRNVVCKICDVDVLLEGQGDYELANWDLHKSTCHLSAPETSPSSTVNVPEETESPVPSPDAIANEPSAAILTEHEPRGTKRARSPDTSEEQPPIPSHDDHPKDDLRPSNRKRDETYEAPQGEGLFGLLKIPWRSFVDGWNLRKNEAASSSTAN